MSRMEKILMEWMNVFSNLDVWWRNRTMIGTYEPYTLRKEVDLKANSCLGYNEKDNKEKEKREEAH